MDEENPTIETPKSPTATAEEQTVDLEATNEEVKVEEDFPATQIGDRGDSIDGNRDGLITSNDEEQQGTRSAKNVTLHWDAEAIDIANQLSLEKDTLLPVCCTNPTRESQRTYMDNEIDIISYLNNKENWYAMASRMALFTGCILNLLGLIFVLITASTNAAKENISTWEYICNSGSVSMLYRTRVLGSSANVLFEAFMGSGSILILLSNFGFYIMPRYVGDVNVFAFYF